VAPCIVRSIDSPSSGGAPEAAIGRASRLLSLAAPGTGFPRPPGRLRRARRAVVAFFVVLGIGNGVWLSRIPAIKQDLHLSDGLLGVALLASPAGLVLVAMLASRIVDRIGSRIPAVTAGVIVALMPIALGLAPTLAALMAALFVFGIAGGLLDVAMNSQAVRVERGYGRPLMTSFHACYSFGGLAGALLGGLFAWAGVGPVPNFAVAGVPLAITALVAGRGLLTEEAVRPAVDTQAGESLAESTAAGPAAASQPAAPAADPGAGETVTRRSHWTLPLLVLGLLSFCSLLCEGAADGWTTVYLHDNLGASAGFAALGYAAFSVAMALGRLAGDRLALRFGAAALVRGCGLLAAVGLAGALLSPVPAGAVAGFAVFGAGLSCTFPQLLSAAGNADPARPANGIARVAGTGYAGMLSGPVLIGGLASVLGLSLALGLPVVLALLLAAGAPAVRARMRP